MMTIIATFPAAAAPYSQGGCLPGTLYHSRVFPLSRHNAIITPVNITQDDFPFAGIEESIKAAEGLSPDILSDNAKQLLEPVNA